MARRAGYSPLKTVQRIIQKGSHDPRDQMVQKLKDELIKVRGKERQLTICQNVLRQIFQKTRLLIAQKTKADQQGKFALDQSLRNVNQLKKQIQLMKGQLKNFHAQLTEVQEQQNSLKRTLNTKNVEIEKLRKQSFYLMEDNQQQVNQAQKLNSQYQEASYELKRIQQRIRDYQSRCSEINKKVTQVRSYINELSIENQSLKDSLKSYQKQNTGITDDLQKKQGKIDHLEQIYSQKHEEIKNCVQNYVQLQHQNQKSLKQTKHKMNLLKMQNDKYAELNGAIAKVQKRTLQEDKQIVLVQGQISELEKVNNQFILNNQQLRRDLSNCHEHLQNLLKNNSILQVQLDGMIKMDDNAINVLRRKKIMPTSENYQSIRSSRQVYRQSAGRY